MEIEINEECKSCSGTGLYIGMAERDGAAIVCSQCKGTGCFHFVHEYNDFTGKKAHKENIERVYQVNPGVVIGNGPDCKLEDFGGMSLADWVNGMSLQKGSEDRKFTCPKWWYQSANYKKAPGWDECFEALGGTFSSCKYFPTKSLCWERWDMEHK